MGTPDRYNIAMQKIVVEILCVNLSLAVCIYSMLSTYQISALDNTLTLEEAGLCPQETVFVEEIM